jgi:hypothetical protein
MHPLSGAFPAQPPVRRDRRPRYKRLQALCRWLVDEGGEVSLRSLQGRSSKLSSLDGSPR